MENEKQDKELNSSELDAKEVREKFTDILEITKEILTGNVHHKEETSISVEHARLVIILSKILGTTTTKVLEDMILDNTMDVIQTVGSELDKQFGKELNNEKAKENKA